jgi:hypothetical protein
VTRPTQHADLLTSSLGNGYSTSKDETMEVSSLFLGRESQSGLAKRTLTALFVPVVRPAILLDIIVDA